MSDKKPHKMLVWLLVATAVVAIVMLALWVYARFFGVTNGKSYKVDSTSDVFIETGDANVLISSGTEDGIMRVYGSNANVTGSYMGSYISIEADERKSSGGAFLTVTLPPYGVNTLNVKSTSGTLSVMNGVASSITLQTKTGDVLLGTTIAKTAQIGTSSGYVTVSGTEAPARVYVRSETGDIDYNASSTALVSLKTTSGDISANYTSKRGEIEIETTSGTIDALINDGSSIAYSMGPSAGLIIDGESYTGSGIVRGEGESKASIKSLSGSAILLRR